MKEAKSGRKIQLQVPPENPWARELKFFYDVEDTVLSGKISFFSRGPAADNDCTSSELVSKPVASSSDNSTPCQSALEKLSTKTNPM